MKRTMTRLLCVLAALLLLAACQPQPNVPMPTDAGETATATPTVVVTADGWYEETAEEDILTVFLSEAQGQWTADAEIASGLSISSVQSTYDGYAAFALSSAGACTDQTVTFTCTNDGAVVVTCTIEVFVNEADLIEVVTTNLPHKEAAATEPPSVSFTPIAYTIDYTRCTDLLRSAVGEQVIQDAGMVIAAFLRHETEAAITPDGNSYLYVNKLGFALDAMCPPFVALTTFDTLHAYDDGVLRWDYQADKETTESNIAAFEAAVQTIMATVDVRDGETAKALLLYHGLTENGVYDYAYYEKGEVTAEESRLPSSAYSAIKAHSGICIAYAEAFCFLCMQLQIDAVPVNGNAPDAFHEWALASLDGAYVYCDPTYDLGGGFRYFGMNETDRCTYGGDFDASTFAICNVAMDGAYSIASTRFSALHDALTGGYASLLVDRDAQTAIFADGLYTLALGA